MEPPDPPASVADRPPFTPVDPGIADLADLRADIPVTGEVAYFNTGATGPSPTFLLDAVDGWTRRHKTDVLADGDAYAVGFAAYEAIRERVAPFVGATADELALTESTSDGLSAVLAALGLERTDDAVVVTTDLEHPAADVPLARLAEQGVTIRRVETTAGRIDTDAWQTAVADADAAVFSSLAWNYGTRLPVAELVAAAEEAGAFTLVDAVQAPGQHPVDVTAWGADAVVGSGHKWLLGAWGSGFLYVDGDAVADLRPAQLGYRSVTDPGGAFERKPTAARFERGTTAIGAHVGLAESVALFDRLGVEHVHEEVLRLTDRLVSQLPAERVVSPAEPETGLVTVDVPEPEATVERLRDDGVAVRSLPDPDCVRVSLHAFNTTAEVERLADELAAIW